MKRLLFLLLVLSLCSCAGRKAKAQRHLDLEGRRYDVVSVGPVKRITTCSIARTMASRAAMLTDSYDEYEAYYDYGEAEGYLNTIMRYSDDPVQFSKTWAGLKEMDGFEAVCMDSHGEKYPVLFGIQEGRVVFCSFEAQEEIRKIILDVYF